MNLDATAKRYYQLKELIKEQERELDSLKLAILAQAICEKNLLQYSQVQRLTVKPKVA